jgi:hypothetical protein
MSETLREETKGNWVTAKPEPYYPSLIEKIECFLGIHRWKHWGKAKKCLKCNRYEA